ncbi:MAG: trigger factor [Candidatus Competibacteraceae bacterium]|nr:trigger factor [Candidatus Competibacteraceae bacterium]
MQVSVEALNDLERRVTVQVPAEQVNKEIQNRLQALSRQLKMAGFRPGKVPLKMVKQLHGHQVQAEVISDLMEQSLRDALIQEKLNPLSQPRIDPKPLEEGQDFEYSVTFEILPPFETTGVETLQIERPLADVTEQDIDEMIETLRWQQANWSPVERPAEWNDRIEIDFTGAIDGESFPGHQAKNTSLILGRKTAFPELEQKLIGLSPDAETEFDVTFPLDYPTRNVAGQTVHLQIKVHRVEEATLPEIDDAFAARYDIHEGGLAQLRQSLRGNMERELREGIKTTIKHQVFQGLLQANPITLPQALVNQEIDQMATQMGLSVNTKDEDKEALRQLKDHLFGAQARRRLTLGLLLTDLATRHHIELDEQRVRDFLQSLAATYEEPEQWIKACEQDATAMSSIRELAFENQVIDWVLERAQVIEKTSNFSEVMAPLQRPALLADQQSAEMEEMSSLQQPALSAAQEFSS